MRSFVVWKRRARRTVTRVLVTISLAYGASGCGETRPPEQANVKADAAGSPSPIEPRAERTARLWATSCALCHVDGNAGAPRIGNAEEWGARLAQNMDVLVQHTVEGINDMPPLGYCMACERGDMVALIEFMTRGIAATSNAGETP